jgi:fructose-1,6-bisphosphatase
MTNDINELLEDKEFVEKILVMQTPEEIQKAFEDKGVKISIKELEEIAKNISKLVSRPNQNEKIADSEMENISGGINLNKGLRTAAAMLVAVATAGSVVYVASEVGNTLAHANEAIDASTKAVADSNQALNDVRGGWFFRWFSR